MVPASGIGHKNGTGRTITFRQMGGSDGGNPNADQPPLEPYTLADELRDQAMLAVGSIATSLSGLTPEVRWELVRQLDATRAPAIACGIKEPEPEPFQCTYCECSN